MAAPNIVNVTSIYGKVQGLSVTTTPTAIITNSSGSNKVLKINTLMISNIDGVNTADITVELYKNQTSIFDLASTVTVPADATLIIISKDNSIYLEENDSLRVFASANGDLDAVCSYEEIS